MGESTDESSTSMNNLHKMTDDYLAKSLTVRALILRQEYGGEVLIGTANLMEEAARRLQQPLSE